jgi:hypothetical protein
MALRMISQRETAAIFAAMHFGHKATFRGDAAIGRFRG